MELETILKLVLFIPFILFAYWRGWYDYILPRKLKRKKTIMTVELSQLETVEFLKTCGYSEEEANEYYQSNLGDHNV